MLLAQMLNHSSSLMLVVVMKLGQEISCVIDISRIWNVFRESTFLRTARARLTQKSSVVVNRELLNEKSNLSNHFRSVVDIVADRVKILFRADLVIARTCSWHKNIKNIKLGVRHQLTSTTDSYGSQALKALLPSSRDWRCKPYYDVVSLTVTL